MSMHNSVAGLACKPAIAMSETRREFCTIVLHITTLHLALTILSRLQNVAYVMGFIDCDAYLKEL